MSKDKDEKFVFLSTRSLKKIEEWADGNERTLLFRIYSTACYAVNDISDINSYDFYLELKRPNQKTFDNSAYWDAHERAFELRDSIGRIILNKINREKRNKRGTKT